MRYIEESSKKGIGTTLLPNRKRRNLVYIDGNQEMVIGTVTDEELFEKGIESIVNIFHDMTLTELKKGVTK